MSDRVSKLKAKPDPHLVAQLESLIETVVARLDGEKECDALVARINALSGGQRYDSNTFFELYAAMSSRDFAEVAAKGIPPRLNDLTREELIEIARTIEGGEQPEGAFFLALLDASYPGAWSSDLIYYPWREMTTEETVDELLHREQLRQSGGEQAVRARLIKQALQVRADPEASPWAQQFADSILGMEAGQP